VRVALVCDAFLPETGGLALQLRDLALALRANGVEARIITARVPATLAFQCTSFDRRSCQLDQLH